MLWEERKDSTLDELRAELSRLGLVVANSTLLRPPRHHAQKKTGQRLSRTGPTF